MEAQTAAIYNLKWHIDQH